MDIIYSRRNVRIPKFNSNNAKNNKRIRIALILFVAFLTLVVVLKSINPVFEESCKEKVREIATNITNIQSSNILNQKKYGNIVELVKDDNGNVTLIKSNVVVINEIASDIAVAIQTDLSKLEAEKITIPAGVLSGINFLSGIGPNIEIKVVPTGNIKTDLKSEFLSTGINQTMHRIYLELQCQVKILTPFSRIDETITNQVLLVETVVMGEIPETYYNLEGFDSNDVIEMVN